MKKYFSFLITILLLAPVSPVFAADTTRPIVGAPLPVTVTAGVPTTFTATATDSESGIASCNFYYDTVDLGSMAVSGGIASFLYTPPLAGTTVAFVFCKDVAGNAQSGPYSAIWINASGSSTPPPAPAPTPTSPPPTPPTPVAKANRLVKVACPAKSTDDHPCRAVYYQGTDGMRHAFPNAKVFFTWYQDFSTVVEVSTNELAALPLGKAVTYRPGLRLVKFTTANKVYAVARGGVLRWIHTEALAIALYGNDWSKKIDDIPDAFFPNYTFGADIISSADFAPTNETANTVTIDANL